MSCTVDVPTEVQQEGLDIVSGDLQAKSDVGSFLISLQENPLPAGRQQLGPKDPTAFWIKLGCGIYVSWEIKASPENMMKLISGRVSPKILVRVLGFGRDKPASK